MQTLAVIEQWKYSWVVRFFLFFLQAIVLTLVLSGSLIYRRICDGFQSSPVLKASKHTLKNRHVFKSY